MTTGDHIFSTELKYNYFLLYANVIFAQIFFFLWAQANNNGRYKLLVQEKALKHLHFDTCLKLRIYANAEDAP